MDHQILRSEIDRSINVITPTEDKGFIETRFVQRLEDTVIIYLSSSTGCDLSCRFCHLTQSGQVMNTPVTVEGYLNQAQYLLDLLNKEGKLTGVKILHWNFMARGDVLDNPNFIEHPRDVLEGLKTLATPYGLQSKFKLSTIFPKSCILSDDSDRFLYWVKMVLEIDPEVEFYYSLYSFHPGFRKRWVPKAIDPERVARMFCYTQYRLRVHHALIHGKNDQSTEAVAITRWLARYQIRSHVNIVRYNPFDERCGVESPADMIDRYCVILRSSPWVGEVTVISKVGKDVKASCGMFVEPGDVTIDS